MESEKKTRTLLKELEHRLKSRMRKLEDKLKQRTNGINEGHLHNQNLESGSESYEAMRKSLGEYGIRIKNLEEAMEKAKEPSESHKTTPGEHEVSLSLSLNIISFKSTIFLRVNFV